MSASREATPKLKAYLLRKNLASYETALCAEFCIYSTQDILNQSLLECEEISDELKLTRREKIRWKATVRQIKDDINKKKIDILASDSVHKQHTKVISLLSPTPPIKEEQAIKDELEPMNNNGLQSEKAQHKQQPLSFSNYTNTNNNCDIDINDGESCNLQSAIRVLRKRKHINYKDNESDFEDTSINSFMSHSSKYSNNLSISSCSDSDPTPSYACVDCNKSFKTGLAFGGHRSRCSMRKSKCKANRKKNIDQKYVNGTQKKYSESYLYRFNPNGEASKIGEWSEKEHRLFIERVKQLGVNGKWGAFSETIAGRTGTACGSYWRKLVKRNIVRDYNYYKTEDGVRFKWRTSTKIEELQRMKRYGFELLKNNKVFYKPPQFPNNFTVLQEKYCKYWKPKYVAFIARNTNTNNKNNRVADTNTNTIQTRRKSKRKKTFETKKSMFRKSEVGNCEPLTNRKRKRNSSEEDGLRASAPPALEPYDAKPSQLPCKKQKI